MSREDLPEGASQSPNVARDILLRVAVVFTSVTVALIVVAILGAGAEAYCEVVLQ